jgi:hypothetical protein
MPESAIHAVRLLKMSKEDANGASFGYSQGAEAIVTLMNEPGFQKHAKNMAGGMSIFSQSVMLICSCALWQSILDSFQRWYFKRWHSKNRSGNFWKSKVSA